MATKPDFRTALPASFALITTGLLAGAFMYGWANVTPTFDAVPLDVHLAYRTELMRFNGRIMPALNVSAIVALVWFAIATHGASRVAAAGSGVLAAASLLVTRFGNVPINGEMKLWAAGDLDPDYQDRLQIWSVYNDVRVAAAILAFALVVVTVVALRTNKGGHQDQESRLVDTH